MYGLVVGYYGADVPWLIAYQYADVSDLDVTLTELVVTAWTNFAKSG